MNRMQPLALLIFTSVLCAPAVSSQDVENAKTPADLIALMPVKEADWPEPFWLICEDEEGDHIYLAWSIKRQGEDIALRFSHGEKDQHSSIKLVYNAKGAFKAVEMREISPSQTYVNTGVVEGDQLKSQHVITITRSGKAPRVLRGEPRTTPLDDLFRATPMHWLPLVLAYHAKRGHLGYSFSMHFFVHDSDEVLHFDVQDIGGEAVKFNGQPSKARLLQIDVWDNPDRLDGIDEKNRVLMSFLKTGECVGVFLKQDDQTMQLRHVTRGEAEKLFSLPADGEPADDEASAD